MKMSDLEAKKNDVIKICVMARMIKDPISLAGKGGEKMVVEVLEQKMILFRNSEGNYKAVYAVAQEKV